MATLGAGVTSTPESGLSANVSYTRHPDLAVSSSGVQAIEVPPTIEAVEAATLGNGE